VLTVLIYPSIIVFIAIVGTFVIIFKGMPLFTSAGFLSGDMVRSAISGMIMGGLVLLIGGTALFVIYFRLFYGDSPEYRLFYLLSFLLQSNVPLIDSLSHCIVSIHQEQFSAALLRVKKDILSGVRFSEAFAGAKLFASYILGWLSVADEQGGIAEICGNIRDYYAQKDERLRAIASRLIEPAVIVLTGAYLLIVMLTVILPVLTYAGGIV
jgi:hypothetical protein